MRSLVAAVTALVLLPAGMWAAEIRGQVKSVDASQNRLTLMVGDKEQIIQVAPQVRVTTTAMQNSRRIFPRRSSVQEYIISLDRLQSGTQVFVMTETRDGREMATQIQANSTSGMSTTAMSSPSGSSSGRRGILRRN